MTLCQYTFIQSGASKKCRWNIMLTVQQLLRLYVKAPKVQSLLKVEKKQNELGMRMYDVYYLLNCTRRSF